MKKTRVRRQPSKSISLVLGFMVLSILVVLTGYVMGRYVMNSLVASGDLTPPGSKEAAGKNDAAGQVEVELPIQYLYRVQVGVFNVEENAIGLTNDLKDDGYPAYATVDPPYEVEAGLFATKEVAKEMAAELKRAGYPVYVKEVVLEQTTAILSGGEKDYLLAVRDALAQVSATLKEQAVMWDEYVRGEMDPEETVRMLQAREEALREIHKRLTRLSEPGGQVGGTLNVAPLVELAITEIYEVKALLENGEESYFSSAMGYYMELFEGYREVVAAL